MGLGDADRDRKRTTQKRALVVVIWSYQLRRPRVVCFSDPVNTLKNKGDRESNPLNTLILGRMGEVGSESAPPAAPTVLGRFGGPPRAGRPPALPALSYPVWRSSGNWATVQRRDSGGGAGRWALGLCSGPGCPLADTSRAVLTPASAPRDVERE